MSYSVIVEQDEFTDGTPCFIASHPELPGCKGQGLTVVDAQKDLDGAREDYIAALIEDGLEVPETPLFVSLTLLMSFDVSQTWRRSF